MICTYRLAGVHLSSYVYTYKHYRYYDCSDCRGQIAPGTRNAIVVQYMYVVQLACSFQVTLRDPITTMQSKVKQHLRTTRTYIYSELQEFQVLSCSFAVAGAAGRAT